MTSTVSRPACCAEFARTGSAHVEICPGFAVNDPANVHRAHAGTDERVPAGPVLIVGTKDSHGVHVDYPGLVHAGTAEQIAAEAIRQFVRSLAKPIAGEPGDGGMILVGEQLAMVRQDPETPPAVHSVYPDGSTPGRWYPLDDEQTPEDRYRSLGEVLGYDEVPEDRTVRSWDVMYTHEDLERAADLHIAALHGGQS